MPDRMKMEAAIAARAGEHFKGGPRTMAPVVECIEQNGGFGGCKWEFHVGTNPKSGVPEMFIRVLNKAGKVVGTFNDLKFCPPVCWFDAPEPG